MARNGRIQSLQLQQDPKEGRTNDILNRNRERCKTDQNDRGHFTGVSNVKDSHCIFMASSLHLPWVFQHHNFHSKVHFPPQCRLLASSRPWESATHPDSGAGCHLLPTRGNLAPRPGLWLWAPSQALGVLGLRRLLSQRASGLGTGFCSFELGSIERSRGRAGCSACPLIGDGETFRGNSGAKHLS